MNKHLEPLFDLQRKERKGGLRNPEKKCLSIVNRKECCKMTVPVNKQGFRKHYFNGWHWRTLFNFMLEDHGLVAIYVKERSINWNETLKNPEIWTFDILKALNVLYKLLKLFLTNANFYAVTIRNNIFQL